MDNRTGLDMSDTELFAVIAKLYATNAPAPTVGAAIRALFPSPTVRQDVPSLDEIVKAMREGDAPETFYHCARVAHATMLELAPRQKTLFDELSCMSSGEIHNVLCKSPEWRDPSMDASHSVASFLHRLANTPAPVEDPDAEAKKLCFDDYRDRGNVLYDDPQEVWDGYTEVGKNKWRLKAANAEILRLRSKLAESAT